MNKYLILFIGILGIQVQSIAGEGLFDIISCIFGYKTNPPYYKLTYFDIRGRAEFIRWIFAVASQPYTDNRIDMNDWQALKPKTPFGQLPVLEFLDKDGNLVELAQSLAIGKFLANRFGLDGSDEMESTLINMYAHQMGDLFNRIAEIMVETNSQRKLELEERLFNQTWPANLQFFERQLKKNSYFGFLIGCSMSWADIYLAQIVELLNERKDTMLLNYPLVKALETRVRSMPRVAEWIANRPPSI